MVSKSFKSKSFKSKSFKKIRTDSDGAVYSKDGKEYRKKLKRGPDGKNTYRYIAIKPVRRGGNDSWKKRSPFHHLTHRGPPLPNSMYEMFTPNTLYQIRDTVSADQLLEAYTRYQSTLHKQLPEIYDGLTPDDVKQSIDFAYWYIDRHRRVTSNWQYGGLTGLEPTIPLVILGIGWGPFVGIIFGCLGVLCAAALCFSAYIETEDEINQKLSKLRRAWNKAWVRAQQKLAGPRQKIQRFVNWWDRHISVLGNIKKARDWLLRHRGQQGQVYAT